MPIHTSRALSGRTNFFDGITQGIMLSHEALGFILAAFQAAIERLNEPPEPSPGLSEAIPWVNDSQIFMRPEGAREL